MTKPLFKEDQIDVIVSSMINGIHGSFARAIGEAYLLADSRHKEILLLSFSALFSKVASFLDIRELKQITWVKHYVHLQDIRSIFTNLETGEMLEKTYRNQCYIRNTNKLCEEPTEFFEVESFDGWDFHSGGFNLQDRELIGSYCCDGDGIVSVELLTDGSIHLNVQGSYMLDLSPNIEEAIEEATKYIKEEYPGIYEEFLNF